MSKQNDRALRFYNEVLGLDRLHYGMWEPGDELTFQNLREAQIRYEDFLVQHIPSDAKTILDVGCGTGMLVKNMLSQGYAAEGLSPDIHQKRNFAENIDAPFHHLGFEDFKAKKAYDCLIMSESAQYINMTKLFKNASDSLKPNGYLMVCDYFVFNKARGEIGKSGHNIETFKGLIDQSEFRLVKEEDITSKITPTLDMGKDLAARVMLALEIGTEKFRIKHPIVTRIVLRMFKKKIEKAKRQEILLDSKTFSENKTYRFFLFQKEA